MSAELITKIDDLAADIAARFASIEKPKTDEELKDLIRSFLSELNDDDPVVRKMRFAGADKNLVGSKFARHGLSTADIEWLYDQQTSRARLGMGSGPSEDLQKAFKAVSDAYYLAEDEVREMDRRALDDVYPRVPKHETRGLNREQWVERQMRAMDTAESGYGSQLIGAQYVGDLWEVSRELGTIAPLFRTFEMTAPTAYLPVEVDFPEMLYVSESTANNSSNYSTSKTGSNRVTVTAAKFLIHQMWSGEMEEDSIIPFVPFLRGQAAKSLAYYADSAILNGDTTNSNANINSADTDPADTKHYLAFDGLRHAALVDNTGNDLDVDTTISIDTFRATRALMRDNTYKTDWGHPVNRSDLVFIADPDLADRIDLLDDVVNAKLMAGNNADLLNGQTASILGHPVIRTMVQSKTVADGDIDEDTASNNVYGQLTAVNVNGGVIGWRRRVKLETERLPATDQSRLVYSLRMGFGRFTPTGAASGIEWTATAHTITV